MMKRTLFAAAAAALVCTVAASACDKDKKIKTVAENSAPCCKATLAKKVDSVMKDMPSMTYKVGDYSTCCSDSAKAKAGKDGKVLFVVADKTYDTETEATLALAELLENEAESMTRVRFAVGKECYGCPMTAGKMAKEKGEKMSYRLAGMDFDSREKADRAAKMIASALASDGRSDSTKPCCAKAAASGKTPCCSKQTAASGQSPCSKSKQRVAAGNTPCSKGKAQQTAAGDAPKCPKAAAAAAAKTAAAEGGSNCCKKASARLASVQDRIRVIVETAAAAS